MIKFVGYTLELLLFLTIVLIFLIRTLWFQNVIADYAASHYSSEFGTQVTVDKVKINGLEYAEIVGLHIKDLKGDTLIYSPKFSGSLAMLSLNSKFAILKAINSENTRVKLQKYEGDSTTNMQFLLDYFASEDTTASKFKIKIKEINLLNVHFSFDNWNIEPIPYGLDYNHIEIKHLYGKVKSLRNRNGVTTFNLEQISLIEKSGFQLDGMECYFLASDKKIKFEQLKILTPFSNLDIKGLSFNYHDYGDLSDFTYAVLMKADIKASRLNLNDLSYFAPTFNGLKNNLKIEGKINGTVNNFNIKDLYIGMSPVTFYTGEIDIKGLPDINNALIYLNIKNMQTSGKELEKFNYKALGLAEPIEVPQEIKKLGIIKVNGTLDGYISEFYSNINIDSDLGSAYTNIQGGLDENSLFGYVGDVSTNNFRLGEMINNNQIGTLNSNFSLKGKGTTLDELETQVIGHLSNFSLLGYNYEKIDLEGSVFHRKFDGTLAINDPNLDFIFQGKVDLNNKKGNYNFNADVRKANLHELNWIDRETASFKGKIAVINSSGSSIDNFDGNIVLSEAEYFEDTTNYVFETIELTSSQATKFREIIIKSEFADVNMTGDYMLANIEESLFALGARMYPSLFKVENMVEVPDESFDLNITIKDLSAITKIFFKELEVAQYSKIGLNYESSSEMLELSASSEFIKYKDFKAVNFKIDTTQKFALYDPFYTFDMSADSLYLNKTNSFQNLKVQSDLYNNNAHTVISWGDTDSTLWANIETDIDIRSPSNMLFEIHPSKIYHSKVGLWEINRDASITMDSTSFNIDNLLITNNSQSVKLKGDITEDPADKLKVVIGQFQMNNLDPFMADTTLNFKGSLTATGYITDIYNNIYLDAYSMIDGLQINEYSIGNLETIAGWNPILERIEITGDLYDNNDFSSLKIDSGFYYVKKEESLDFSLSFKETNIEFANVFMPEGFNDLQGLISGNLFIKGNAQEPLLDGKLHLDKAGLNIEMLNTAYHATGDILIEPDNIFINSLPVIDKMGTKAYLTGSFFHQNFDRYSYDFFVGFNDPFLVMNTNYKMNPLYYGDAFVTGDVAIAFEDTRPLEIQVNAKSEKGTNITLPLYGSQEVELQDFISFVNKDTIEEDYKVDLEGINLNLSMDITEDAKIQLVFDDVVGDAMKGIGTGHIDMYIDQFYDFYMFGNYEITEGSYLFTLKDLINKKFKIKKGGSINWYGDPYEADIDLTAVYGLKTSLYDIMPDNQREAYRQKTDVECEMHLTENLFNPILNFDINLPRSDENAKTILRNSISTEAEMNKQVFSLLLLNKFLPGEYNTSGSSSGGSALGNTTSEMLSNQLSNMLSKFSDDFDIGFNYQPGDEVSSQEMALALSTQLFDDRVTITTNLGVSHQNAGENSNSLIGDVDVEYKVNEEGNVRVHAFNKSNEYDITQQEATYTQGVGVFYQESFSTFSELMCKLKNLFIKKENECSTCNEQCGSMLTEAEREACREAQRKAIKKCKEDRKSN